MVNENQSSKVQDAVDSRTSNNEVLADKVIKDLKGDSRNPFAN